MKIEILRYHQVLKGATLGICSIQVHDWGIIIDGISLLQKDRARWSSMPSKKDNVGKYWAYIRWPDRNQKNDFDRALFAAFDAYLKKQPIENNSQPEEPEFPF